ncbi:RNA 2',3'-cyclic phosphodiesterase [Candidatus Bipolaricaulota bacterium]|nr:RNA 2',3'-cyclic phosphodiesterase [Candidatus Bipolaricaulota bacterium]
MRAFFCIPIPDPLRGRLHDIAEGLRAQTKMRVSWVARQNYHITVRFIGDIDPGLLVNLEKLCRALCEGVAPFECSLERVGAFPNIDRARVLWVGGEPPPSFRRLMQALTDALVDLGFPRTKKESLIHVTVARVKDSPDPALPDLIAELNPIAPMKMMADRIVLMESTLTQRGAVYASLFTAKLGNQQQ